MPVSPARLGLAAVALVAGSCGALRDARGDACGFMDEPVAAQVAMEHARDYRRHFPRMGLAPELEIDAPAFAVAFAGPLVLGGFGGYPPLGQLAIRRSAESLGVVCVVVNGFPTYYTDVDITGVK